MKITIIAIGQRLPSWADELCLDFLRRFGADWKLELKALKAETRSSMPSATVMQREAERIRAAVPKSATLVVLDERGKTFTTSAFSAQLQLWQREALEPCFVIGGADGLDAALKADATQHLRLSDMTLPHAFARVLLLEQLYRAYSIQHNHPYHRE